MVITVDATLSERYHLVALLGRGGMADVYRARDLVLERPVAVKVVRGASEDDARRFTREVRTMAALSHPGIVQLFDAGAAEDTPYLVMELVEGSDLPAELTDGALDPERVSVLGRQLAGALDHAHGLGVVHRDVKPGNVLIDVNGRVRLSDFGIAQVVDATRVTAMGMTSGTAAYLAPEQLAGEDVGPPADVYALGLVLLEALTGHREYTGTAVEAAMARLNRDPVVPEDLPAPWTALLTAMTTRDPARRPSARQVAARLSGGVSPPSADALQTTTLQAHTGEAHTGEAHTGEPDTGEPDTGEPDTGEPDTGEDPAPPGEPAAHRARAPARQRWPALAGIAGLLAVAAAFVAVSFATGGDVPGEQGPDQQAPPVPESSLPAELDDAIDRLERAVRP